MKLNLGSGTNEIPGFVNVDRINGDEVFPLSYESGSISEIRASHILEHFGFKEIHNVLAEWCRVLAPGGRIRVAVPDVKKVLKLSDETKGFHDPQWRYYLMGGQTSSNDFHKTCWNRELLTAELRAAGFERVQEWQSDGLDTSCHKVSLNIEAFKPMKDQKEDLKMEDKKEETQDIKIAAAMSIPRLGFNDMWGCAQEALRPWGIPIRRYTGAFWGQCLESVLEGCVRDDLDWVLCIDYDTVFTKHHVDSLIGLLGQNPHMDAVAGLQTKRNDGTPLMSVEGRREVEATGEPIKVSSAHFGLTLIRVDAIRDIPKPWFRGQPGPDGSWKHKDKLDPDIWFWHQWRLAGKSVYVDTNCRIGHLELMVSQFNENMDLERITPREWYKRKEEKK